MTQQSMIMITSSFLMMAVIFSSLVYMGSRTLLFGIALPTEASQDAAVRRIRRNYVWLTGGCAAVIGAACYAWMRQLPASRSILCWATAIVLLAIASYFAIWISRMSAQRLKAARGWEVAVQTKRAASLAILRTHGTVLSFWWYSVHAAVMALCISFAIARWDAIPEWFSTYLVDHDSSKSVWTVFMWNFMQALTIGLFAVFHVVISRSRTSIDPQDREGSLRKQLKLKKAYSILAWGASLLIVVFQGVTQAVTLRGWKDNLIFGSGITLWAVLFLALVGVMLYLRIRGIDQHKDAPSQEERHWKWLGSFYVNAEDPALFVPDRYGFGYTINMAKPIGKIIAAAVVAMLAIFVFVIVYFLQ